MSSLPRQSGVTEFLPERGVLSLTLMFQGFLHTLMQPKQLPNKILGFVWHGSSYSVPNTAKLCDWCICQNGHFSLVKMYFAISQLIPTFTQ